MNFPLFIDLKDKEVLIVGAGAIAARRATVLVEFGAKVTVVAPEEGRRSGRTTLRSSKVLRQQGGCISAECENCRGKIPWECQTIQVRELAQTGRLAWKQHAFCEQDLEELEQSFSGYRCHQ